MNNLRIVWKDSRVRTEKKTLRYRKHLVSGYGHGWVTDIPGDDNIYKSHYCAFNAINKALGKRDREPCEKRKMCGIVVIGNKNDIA